MPDQIGLSGLAGERRFDCHVDTDHVVTPKSYPSSPRSRRECVSVCVSLRACLTKIIIDSDGNGWWSR